MTSVINSNRVRERMAVHGDMWEFECERCEFHGCAFDETAATELAAAHERASGHPVLNERRRSVVTE